MASWINEVATMAAAMDPMEAVAVVCSILYLVLAGRENNWCWFFAAVSVILYTILLVEANLWAETALQGYYLFMAGYGFYQWKFRKGKTTREELPISVLNTKQHLLLIGLIVVGTAGVGAALHAFTPASMPFVDSFTTVGALVTTWMVTRKYLENWLYWIIVDGVGVYLYASRGLYLTSVLFAAYVIMVIIGYFHWRNLYRKQDVAVEQA